LARLDVQDGHLEIEVTDDGCATTARTPGGVGILSMVERAAELGGWCVVDVSPGTGTVVRSQLPVGAR
jgi:signal transduction histidine kinase